MKIFNCNELFRDGKDWDDLPPLNFPQVYAVAK